MPPPRGDTLPSALHSSPGTSSPTRQNCNYSTWPTGGLAGGEADPKIYLCTFVQTEETPALAQLSPFHHGGGGQANQST